MPPIVRAGNSRRNFSLLAPRAVAVCALAIILLSSISSRTLARADATIPTEVLAYGTDDLYWIARVEPVDGNPPTRRTTIQVRGNASKNWRPFAQIEGRIIAMTHRGSDIAAVLDNGAWMLLWEGGGTIGEPAPNAARLLSLAGDGTTIWAVAAGEIDPIAPATAPSSSAPSGSPRPGSARRPSNATAPSTQPVRGTALLQWEAGRWTTRAMLPTHLEATSPSNVSLAIVAGRPSLAIGDGEQRIQLVRLESDGKLTAMGSIARSPRFTLLGRANRPMLWLQSGGDAGSIVPIDELNSKPVALAVPEHFVGSDPFALAVATGQIRFVFMHGGKLYEQSYNPTGTKSGATAALGGVRSTGLDVIPEWIGLTLLLLLTVLVFGPARRRESPEARSGEPGGAVAVLAARNLHIAALRLRLQAGVLDALPILAVSFYTTLRTRSATPDQAYEVLLSNGWISGAALLVYFLHTLLSELFTGKTLGKWIFGLRVTTAEGERPRAAAIFVRNIIRLLEVPLCFPLVILAFTPLQQRIGDIAASTIVVDERALPEDARDDDDD